MKYDLIKEAVAAGLVKGIAVTAVGAFIVSVIIAAFMDHFGVGYDDTDARPKRSQLVVRTDCRTGLQYLTTASGGLTPRLDPGGSHMRAPCEDR